VRAKFAGSVITVADRPHQSWSSPWLAITGPLSPLFPHSLSFPVSPRSSYRASLRQLWPDLAGAPSYPSAVRHHRRRALPLTLAYPCPTSIDAGWLEEHVGALDHAGAATGGKLLPPPPPSPVRCL
jgi:hypothetical protein